MISTIGEIIGDPEFPEGVAWKRRNFQVNETLVHEGAEGTSVFLLETGNVRVTARVVLEDDRRVQPGICDLGAGDLFGELSLFEHHPRSASVIAITDGQLIEIDAGHLGRYLDTHPEIGYQILKTLFSTLIQRLSKANQRIESLFAWGLKVHQITEYL